MATDTAGLSLSGKPRRVGVFGGTFDPVHQAHIALAVAVKRQLQLDEIRLIPCGKPPHKKAPVAAGADRFAMLELATKDELGLVVDDWEISQPEITYTYKTLEHLSQHENWQLFFLMGLDSLHQFTTWRNWVRILELCHLAVVKRPNLDDQAIPEKLRARLSDAEVSDNASTGKIYFVDFEETEVSATEIRKQLETGKCPEGSMDAAVVKYITEKRLYQHV